MSKLTREDILKLAKLARLQLSNEEVDQFSREISAILGYVEQLQNVDLETLQPTSQVTGLKNVTRPDEVQDYGASTADLMKNAPATEQHQFRVRRMVG